MSNIVQLIEKSFDNPNYLDYWLNALIDEQISEVKALLKEPILSENNFSLIQEIQETIPNKNIHWLDKIWNTFFHSQKEKELEKKYFILEDKLHSAIYKLEIEYKKNHLASIRVTQILEKLEQLHKRFATYKNSDFFLNQIDDKIAIIKTYHLTLALREKNLLESTILYNNIKIKG